MKLIWKYLKIFNNTMFKWMNENWIENYFRHWDSLSVNGTYMTPMTRFVFTVPSANLSICSNDWSPPRGPTGITNLPPGFNWSISYMKKNRWKNYPKKAMETYILRKNRCSRSNMNRIKRCMFGTSFSTITN